jgi:hypothetical protein
VQGPGLLRSVGSCCGVLTVNWGALVLSWRYIPVRPLLAFGHAMYVWVLWQQACTDAAAVTQLVLAQTALMFSYVGSALLLCGVLVLTCVDSRPTATTSVSLTLWHSCRAPSACAPYRVWHRRYHGQESPCGPNCSMQTTGGWLQGLLLVQRSSAHYRGAPHVWVCGQVSVWC